jgi:hypothetical protein
MLREPAHLFVKDCCDVLGDSRCAGAIAHRGLLRGSTLVTPAPGYVVASMRGDPKRDSKQPATDRLFSSHRDGPADEYEESGLKGVMGVVLVTEDRAAHAQDHRSMAVDDGAKRRFGRIVLGAAPNEASKQLFVSQADRGAGVEQLLNVVEHRPAAVK